MCGGGGRGRDQRRQELLGLHAAGEGLLAAVAVAVPLPGVARAAQDAHHAADIVDIVDIRYHYLYGLRITSCRRYQTNLFRGTSVDYTSVGGKAVEDIVDIVDVDI